MSMTKQSSREKDTWEDGLSEHQFRGWRVVSAAGMQGKGPRKRTVCFTDTGMKPWEIADRRAQLPTTLSRGSASHPDLPRPPLL